MKKNLSLLGLLATILMMCGCANDDNPPVDNPKYITISTDIAERTRVNQANFNFETDDKVSIYAWTGSPDVVPAGSARVVNNSINTLNASGEWIPSPQMLWRNDTAKHYFVGIYPHNDTPVDDLTAMPFTIKPTPTVDDFEWNDLLLATRKDGVTYGATQSVEMDFIHAMAQLVVYLNFRSQWGGVKPTVEKAVLANAAQGGTVDCLACTFNPSTDRSDQELYRVSSGTELSGIVFPQSGVNQVVVTIDGHNYTYTHPTDIPLESNTLTVLYLNVGRDNMTLGNMSVYGWQKIKEIKGCNAMGENPVKYITDLDKLNMLFSLADMEKTGDGRIYSMNYTADYKLDEALASGATDVNGLFGFVAKNLYDVQPQQSTSQMSFGAGCSAFAATESSTGNYIMGRNYDFYHAGKDGKEAEIAAIVVHTAPKGYYKSVSVVDGFWLGMNRGFHTDGRTDLSMLMAAPYAFMDGINEKGFAIGVLHLDGKPTAQSEPGKTNVQMNIAMRMLLDRAADVSEAAELLKQYNMHMASPAGGSFHFFMADAKGQYAIVEYVSPTGDITETPWKIDVMSGEDKYRYVTNFYVSDDMKDSDYGILHSSHGKSRYDKMKQELENKGFYLSTSDARQLLEDVSQDSNGAPTSHTQWSSLYNLSQKSLKLWLQREFGNNPMEISVRAK